jgi:predicted nucleotidyltransferase
MDTSELIEEAARRIRAAAPGAQVILFGSHARGEAHVDLLVVEPTVRTARWRRYDCVVSSEGWASSRTSSW